MASPLCPTCDHPGMSAIEHLSRALAAGDSLDWWQLAGSEERPFLAAPEPLPPETQAVFANGFRGIGDLPCRKLFRRTMAARTVELPDPIVWQEYDLAVNAQRLEFSSFWHCPTHVQRYARTFVAVEVGGDYLVRLLTCGGVRLWVDGRPAARFTPFTRNEPRQTEVRLPLAAGRNEIILHLEELCERDTTWVVALVWQDARPARLSVPAPGGAAVLEHLAGIAQGLRLANELHEGARAVRIVLSQPAALPLTLRLCGIGRGNATAPLPEASAIARAGSAVAELGPATRFPQGYHQLGVMCEAAGMRTRRRLSAGFAQPTLAPPAAADPAGRRRQALEYVARHGNPQIGRALAIAAVGGDGVICAALIEDALERIERREDCSDFWLPPLLWLLRAWPRRLGTALRARARRAILGWRYWMDEPGNDVMWFWSENHTLCFHTAQYLAGQAFPDEVFVNSGRTGREQQALGRRRLERWFADVEANGFVEWHSPAYYPIDCIGLLALHQLAPDAAIRDAARRALDRLFLLIALSTLNGVPSSTQGRTYDRDLKLPALTETAALTWIEWGAGALGPMAFAVPLLCLGTYASPAAARRLGLWNGRVGLQARYSQGHDHAARLVAWKSRDALLGSVVDHHPGEPGYQAVVTQAHLEGHPDARIWINNPGQDDPFGTRRPSYWAGDGVMPRAAQWRNLALLHYRMDRRAIPWTHAYARRDVFEEVLLSGPWLFVRSGRGLAAVMAANGLQPVESGPTAGYEVRSPGRYNTWLVRVGARERYGSLAAFAAALRAEPILVVPGEHVSFRDPEHGEARLGWSGRFTVAGRDRRHDVPSVDPELTLDDGGTLDLRAIANGMA
jgi:hypothetical protein